MKNFWQEMKKPVLCLAPMSDVTDVVFRYIIAKCSNLPYVTFTEFVSADGLVLAPEDGRKKLLKNLEYSEKERPIVAQIFGNNPENIEKAAKLIMGLKFDGLDINMGCPDKNVEKQGAGAALIKNPKLAREIIKAAKRGVNKKIPISVKTRLGYNEDELETWLPELLAENPATVIIHARTRKEGYKGGANWKRIKRAVEIRNKENPLPLIIGNGDVENVEDGAKKCKETGADGAMIGRAVIGNPWIFSYSRELENKERLKVLLEHTKLFDKKFGNTKSSFVLKKHFKRYLNYLGSRELRLKLMETKNISSLISLLNKRLLKAK